ncbi:hypothetical protein F4803DRAFT_568531 [Xylaria telfairii]|nr:hypothetical protein F4803DRAFT_568531 [Xylaria telfairii]
MLTEECTQYCGKLCQKRHWKGYKTDCRSPLSSGDWRPQYKVENREPSWKNWEPADEEQRKFVEKFERHDHCMYLDLPPIDVLNLPGNEGSNIKSMNILFANLSTLVKTIISLPVNAPPHLRIVLNDKDEYVTVRNLILLLLAITSKDDLVTAECAVHFWYSHFVPDWCYSAMRSQVMPLLRDVPKFPVTGPGFDDVSDAFGPGVYDDRKITSFALHTVSVYGSLPTTSSSQFLQPYSKTWKHGRVGSLKMEVNRRICAMIFLTILAGSSPGIRANAMELFTKIKATMKPWDGKYKNKDDWDQKLDMVAPAQQHNMMKATSDPLSGRDIDEVIKVDNGAAQNDIYGKLFYHIRNQFKLFVSRLRTLKVNIEVNCSDAKALPALLSGTKFDRIVISELTDDPVWDTQRMIRVLGPMLKDKSVNRRACVGEDKKSAQGGASGQRST